MSKRVHSLEEIESELIFDRDVSGESGEGRLKREGFERLTKAVNKLAMAFGNLGEAADRKAAEFREEGNRLRLDAELDQLERNQPNPPELEPPQ